MEKGKTNYDLSELSLKELLELYETLNAFLAFLDENKIEGGGDE